VSSRKTSASRFAPLAGCPSDNVFAVTVKVTFSFRRTGLEVKLTWYLQSSSSATEL